jgi:hypothetical protein
MIVAIHQPNYLPWLGYFYKMAESDVFVIFDDVQLARGKSYVTRNLVKTSGRVQWLTVPVRDKGELNLIKDVIISQDGKWQNKHWKTLQGAYARAPYFNKYEAGFREIYGQIWESLCSLNIALIKAIKDMLGIKAQLVLSSELNVQAIGAEKILGILKSLEADTYITGEGKGSQRYIEEAEFKQNNIKLVYHQFRHPVYHQLWGDFIPNLSIIDLLFNEGEKSLSILKEQDE